jgi:hypothetical protein
MPAITATEAESGPDAAAVADLARMTDEELQAIRRYLATFVD